MSQLKRTCIALLLCLANTLSASASEPEWLAVSQISNVSPQDWEFAALNSLLPKCRGDRLPQMQLRSEFAAKFQNCWQKIQASRLRVDADTLATVQRLQADFRVELSALTRRVEQLSTRVANLEDKQFSPRVELEGEVIFAPVFARGSKTDRSQKAIDKSVFLGSGISLSLETSFTGKDSLKVSLESTQILELEEITGTRMSNLGFDGDDEGQLVLDEVEYQFPIGDRTEVTISAEGAGLGDYAPTVSPWVSDSEDGSISTFGKENPIRRQGSGAGIGISHKFSDAVNLSVGYVSNRANDPESGLFASPNATIAQLTLNPSKFLALSFTYTNSYNSFRTGTGSESSNNPFDDRSEAIATTGYGVEATLSPTPKLHLGGRVGYLRATAEDLANNPQANIATWSAFLAVEDLGKKDNLFGIIWGQPPKLVKNTFLDLQDRDTSLHLEAFYRWQLNKRISITPGVLLITNPEHNASNDDIWVGTIRTTFTF